MGYYVGMLGNLLPLPGGVGGSTAAMIGAFSAFGVDFGLADRRRARLPRRSRSGSPRSRARSPTSSCARRCTLERASGGSASSRRPALIASKVAILSEVTTEHRSHRGRRHRRQRPGGLHRRALHLAREPPAARHRGLPLGRPAAADDRCRELPRLPRRDHGPRAHAAHARPGRALRHALRHRPRDEDRARRASPATCTPSGSATRRTARAPSSSRWAPSTRSSACPARRS